MRNILYVIFAFYVLAIFVFCNDNPADPGEPPEEVPCDTVFVEVEIPLGRVEGVWVINYIQDPSSNNYRLIQNDVSIFLKITPSAIFEEVTVEVPGNFEIGDKIEPFYKGSNSRIWYRFQGELK